MYVALLRGINVGGKNAVSMATLKTSLEAKGFKNVSTYINSGNVFFESPVVDQTKLARSIEKILEQQFKLYIPVVVRSHSQIMALNKAVPDSWTNDTINKTDVLFLWDAVDTPQVTSRLKVRPEIEECRYIKGALVWRVDRSAITRSGLLKIMGTDFYKQVTLRNINTVRKLAHLMSERATS